MKTELDIYIRARYPLLWIVTPEEQRALGELQSLAESQRKRLLVWSITAGVENPATPGRADAGKRDPLVLLQAILDGDEPCIWVLRDFHPYLKDANVIRRLREVAFALQASNKTVILLGPVLKIPPELEKEITVVDFDLPTAAELTDRLAEIVKIYQRKDAIEVDLNRRQRERLVLACLGLTLSEAENALAKAAIQAEGRLDGDAVEVVTAEKQQIIRKSGLLEYYASDERLASVGGLATLKEWLRKRARGLRRRGAGPLACPRPKGMLLLGVQGCGKSLVAKSVANSWQLPLLRFDVGRMFGSLVGSSEENVRTAIRTAETIAPAVLWVDEIDKGFSGVGSSDVSDAGTTARVFGTFLTWLPEKKAPVFVVATANDVVQLPPELLRKGRFDEIFFVDLPHAEERADIWRIHLAKRNRDPDQFDIATLTTSSDRLSGAEIEQAVIDGLYEAFDKDRPLGTDDIIDVLSQTIPLSTMMSEEIDGLRDWAKYRARPASGPVDG